jgi:hypothetical protein
MLWQLLVLGKLYVCTDPVPVLNFIPPFVHHVPDPNTNKNDGHTFYDTGDYYIYPEYLVYSLWGIMIVGSMIISIIVGRKMSN